VAEPASALLDRYKAGLIGVELTHTWRGRGSAIFLEFGALTPRRRLDGSAGNAAGEFGIMIQWSWRVETSVSILFGSWSEDALWEDSLRRLHGSTVSSIWLFGDLPELGIALSSGHRVLSFMTSDGDPEWTMFDRRESRERWLRVRDGLVVEAFATG
jgi:hypothetical protein